MIVIATVLLTAVHPGRFASEAHCGAVMTKRETQLSDAESGHEMGCTARRFRYTLGQSNV